MTAEEQQQVATLSYDAVAITIEHAHAMRDVIIRLRDEALCQTEFGWAVKLSHVAATFSVMAARIWGEAWQPRLPEGVSPPESPFTPLIEPFRDILKQAADVVRPFAGVTPSSFHPADGSDNESYAVVLASDHAALGQGIDFSGAALRDARDFVTWFDNGMNNPPNDGGLRFGDEAQ